MGLQDGPTWSRRAHERLHPGGYRLASLALVRRFCLEAAGYAVAGYRWLSPASFSSTLIVCPRP